jgi:hypothetical protein
VAAALVWVRELQFWIGGFALLIAAIWIVVVVRRHRQV